MPRFMEALLLPLYMVLLPLLAGGIFLRRRRVMGAVAARTEVANDCTFFALVLIALCGLELFLGPFFGSVWGAAVSGLTAGRLLLLGLNVARKKRDSALLLRVGYAEVPPWAASVSGVVLVLLLLTAVFLEWPRVTLFEICWALLLIALPVVGIQGGRNGVQLRDCGVLRALQMFPWKSIDSYTFDDLRQTVTLNLAQRSLWNPFATLTFAIPFVDQAETLAILDQRLSQEI